jgi:hypothetical protein
VARRLKRSENTTSDCLSAPSSWNIHHVVAAQIGFLMEFRSEANRSAGKLSSKGG